MVFDGKAEMPGEHSKFCFNFRGQITGTEETNSRTQLFNASVCRGGHVLIFWVSEASIRYSRYRSAKKVAAWIRFHVSFLITRLVSEIFSYCLPLGQHRGRYQPSSYQ